MDDARHPSPIGARLRLGGRVQGVGLRPFAFRLARRLGVHGCAYNDGGALCLEIEAAPEALEAYVDALRRQAPPRARVDWLLREPMPAAGAKDFAITASRARPGPEAPPPDLALCPACRAELLNPRDRRYRYPFIACADCGPRWSVLARLPYDRANTSMAAFAPCAQCLREYRDPDDRRFHAQLNACPDCGPQLALWDAHGRECATRAAALQQAVAALRAGSIVAVQGLGGFHLVVDARNPQAIARLRARKQRPHKPLAVMFADAGAAARHCRLGDGERALLECAAAPIVLLASNGTLPAALAPGNPLLGAMLACTPLQLLLSTDFGGPLVATSGNRSGEPQCYRPPEALQRLAGIADAFLVNDRPILQPVDDSVAQWVAGRPLWLRSARGVAPLALPLPGTTAPVLAVGGHLKCTLALHAGERAVVAPPTGDLASIEADTALRRAVQSFPTLLGQAPAQWVCDRHPDYRSAQLAQAQGAPLRRVQHHHAHVAAVMAEHGLEDQVLGLAWDGNGLGDDGQLWGGEVLRARRADYVHVAQLRPFPLPGGDRALREPARAALGLLFEHGGGALERYAGLPPMQGLAPQVLSLLQRALERQLNCPRSSSIGRLFDAVAALLGLCAQASFEGQAAMALQFAAESWHGPVTTLRLRLDHGTQPWRLDWAPLVDGVLQAQRAGTAPAAIAAGFHAGLVQAIVELAAAQAPLPVVLAGGCFQNRLLLESAVAALRAAGHGVYWPLRLPPNDAALALGQLAVHAAASRSAACA